MKRLTTAAIAAVILFVTLASQAYAATLTWNLLDVSFEDGGTATGSFGFDADTGNFSNVNITTTTESLFGGTTYSAIGNFANDINLDFRNPIENSAKQYRFAAPLSAQMTNAGGTIAFKFELSVFEFLCDAADCNQASEIREITAGSIVASPVPIPAALPLLISALGAFGYLGWRRKRLVTG